MKRPIENVLELFERKIEAPNSDSYVREIIITEDGETTDVNLFEEIDKCLENQNDVIKWDLQLIGSFDSPGYDLRCYSLSVLYTGCDLEVYPINIEFF